tara:strand:+ start:816 stop:989 length:174 start_codon:yes stop_codon:yes gene_type:complete
VFFEKIPYLIYFLGVLILVLPAFLSTNLNIKTFFKNLSIWAIIFFIIFYLYKILNKF